MNFPLADFNQVVIFERSTNERNEYGAVDKRWTQKARCKAKVVYSRIGEDQERDKSNDRYDVKFIIRTRKDINIDLRAVWDDKVFRIVAIERDMKRQYLFIHAKNIENE